MVRGFKDDKGTFHPVGQSKGVRSRRDTSQKTHGVKIRKARENFAELLRNNLESFNRNHTVQLEYGSQGGASKGLMFKGTNSFIVGKMTREQALDAVMVLDRYIDKAGGTRRRRDDSLQPFVKTRIAENITDLELSLKDLREESRMKQRLGKPTGQIDSEIKLLGGARNSILSLLEQVPEPLHKEIVEKADKDRQEMLA